MPEPPESATPRLDARRAKRLRDALVAWYREHARDLPWRRTSDPYAIWLSEVMLQQTRVEAVREHWVRFLGLFPTVEELAAAPEDDVLAAWSGLGYYRRARSLHAAAKVVASDHGGRFPRDEKAARALPGVGPYTAGAVLSIAYDRPVALVDGNVERVFARLFGLEGAAGSGPLQRRCWELASALVPPRSGAGEWNQALMELGATVCTPRSPECARCPWARGCAAREAGRQAELPGPKVKPSPIDVELELLAIERPGAPGAKGAGGSGPAWLLEQRPDRGRMARMWQLPTRELLSGGRSEPLLFPAGWPAGWEPGPGPELFPLRHGITRHRILAVVRRGSCPRGELPPRFDWVEKERVGEVALTGMARKALERLSDAGAPLFEHEKD